MKTKTATRLRLLAAFTAASLVTASAAPRAFDFKDPKGVNNVQFQLDAPLESISGTATGIAGSVSFDPANPSATHGRIVLDTATLSVGNPLMREHLHSANWLDTATHPTIVFEASTLSNVRTQGAQVLADVAGKLTVKGITQDITVPVAFTYLADKLGARLGNPKLKGDLLVLRATFKINRSDFGIQSGQAADKVAESIQLTLSIAGAAPRSS